MKPAAPTKKRWQQEIYHTDIMSYVIIPIIITLQLSPQNRSEITTTYNSRHTKKQSQTTIDHYFYWLNLRVLLDETIDYSTAASSGGDTIL